MFTCWFLGAVRTMCHAWNQCFSAEIKDYLAVRKIYFVIHQRDT